MTEPERLQQRLNTLQQELQAMNQQLMQAQAAVENLTALCNRNLGRQDELRMMLAELEPGDRGDGREKRVEMEIVEAR